MALFTWIGSFPGLWEENSNWDLGLYPSSNPLDNVLIDDPGLSGSSVTHSFNTTVINDLTLTNVDLILSGGSLQLNSVSFTTAIEQITLEGGALIGDGSTTTIDDANIEITSAGGTLDGIQLTGDLDLNDDLDFVALANSFSATGDINLDGDFSYLYTDDLGILNETINLDGLLAGIFDQSTTSDLTFGAASIINMNGEDINITNSAPSRSIINQGTINSDGTAATSHTINPFNFSNAGTINAIGGIDLEIGGFNGTFLNDVGGVVDANNSTIRFNGDWDNNGQVDLVDANWELGGTFTSADIGSFSRTGTTMVAITGTLDNTGSTSTIDSSTGDIKLQGGTILNGTVDQNMASLDLTDFGGTLDGIQLTGNLDLSDTSDSVTLANSFSATGDINLDGDFASLNTDDLGILNETINLDGLFAGIFDQSTASDLTFGAASIINMNGEGININNSAPSRTIINQGTINSDGTAATFHTINPFNFSNAGTINATNGIELDIMSNITNLVGTDLVGGTWRTSGDSIIRFGDGVTDFSIITNNANIILDGASSQLINQFDSSNALEELALNDIFGSLTLQNSHSFSTIADLNNAGNISLESGSSLNVTGQYIQTNGNIHLSNANLSAPVAGIDIQGGTFSVEGLGNLFNGSTSVAGDMALNDATGTLDVTGDFTSTGALNFEVEGPSSFDQINASGTATISGDINIATLSSYNPHFSDSFSLITASTLNAGAATLLLPSLGPDFNFFTEILPTTLNLLVNATPDAVDDTAITDEDTAVMGNVITSSDTDDDGDMLTVTAINGNAGDVGNQIMLASGALVTLDAAGDFTYDPNDMFESLGDMASTSDSFSYTVSDGNGGSRSATVDITINGVNDIPVNTVPGSQTVDEDISLPISGLSVTDVDGNLAQVELSVNSGTLNITLSGGATIISGTNGSSSLTLSGSEVGINNTLSSLVYQGNPNFNGNDTLNITTTDSLGAQDTDSVSISVNPIQDDPEAIEDSAVSLDGMVVAVDVLGNDIEVDGEAISLVSFTQGNNGTVTRNENGTPGDTSDDTLIYTPNAGFTGNDSFDYTISDGNGGSDTATVKIAVIPSTGANIIDDGDLGFSTVGNWLNSGIKPSYNSDSLYNSAGTGNDSATWNFTGLAAGTYHVATTWSAHPNRATDSPFTVSGGTTPFTVEINQENTPDDFMAQGVNWESLGLVTITGDSVSVSVNDDADQSVVADAIRLVEVNDAPEAVDDTAVTIAGMDVSVDVLDNDSDIEGDTLLLDSFTQGTNGSVTRDDSGTVGDTSDDTLIYTPNSGFAGSDSFTYTISDGNGGVDTATVNVSGDAVTVIDDGDLGFSTVGNWLNSGIKPSYNSDSLYNSAGTGNDSATWNFTGLAAGTYHVATTWSAHPNRATNTPFTVSGGATPFTVELNQENTPDDFMAQGVNWESLGLVTITGDSVSVSVNDDADQSVVADAIRIVEVNTPPSLTIIDDGDSAFSTSGSWLNSSIQPSYNGDSLYNGAGSGNDSAMWQFDGLSPDTPYLVSTTWSTNSNRATDSPFTVTGGTTPFTIDVNQEIAPNDFFEQGVNWEILGAVTLTGSSLSVSLTDDANENVVADAIAMLPLDRPTIIDDGDLGFSTSGSWLNSSIQPSYNGDSLYNSAGSGADNAQWDFTGLASGTYLVSASWSAHPSRATDAPFTIIGGDSPLTVDINQEVAPDDFFDLGSNWEILGSVTISGDSISVQLSDDADQFVVADAIRIDPIVLGTS